MNVGSILRAEHLSIGDVIAFTPYHYPDHRPSVDERATVVGLLEVDSRRSVEVRYLAARTVGDTLPGFDLHAPYGVEVVMVWLTFRPDELVPLR